MSRSSSLGTKAALSRLLTQDRITGTWAEIARVHETNRQNIVKEILVHIFLMSKFGFFNAPLTVGAAKNQYFQSTGGDNAAHCSPGQIFCGGQAVQKRITANDDIEMIVECLFSKTDGIEKKFNIADSSAEGNQGGQRLRRVFGEACFEASRVGKFYRIDPRMGFSHVITQIFSQYQLQGEVAIDQAMESQRQKLAAGVPLQGTTRREVLDILEVYRNTLRDADPSLETVYGLFPRDLWHDYSQIRRA